MSAWVEVHVEGGHRAYVQAGAVIGVMLPKDSDGTVEATHKSPLMLIMQGGESFPGVFGLSANQLIARCAAAKAIMRQTNMDSLLCRIDGEYDEPLKMLLTGLLEARHGGAT